MRWNEELPQSLVTTSTNSQSATTKADDPNTIEAQRDVYRRMLNYSMSSTLAQQYYLSQYGYNYLQDRSMFSKADAAPGTSTTTTAVPNQASLAEQIGSQLPSIDSVLLNLSTKKTNGKPAPSTVMHGTPSLQPSTTAIQQNVQAYGLQALANAAIEADPKAFSEADTDRKDGQKSELEDVTDTDSSNMSPSDSSTSQIMSPPRNTYSHLMAENPHISIPAAHSHQHQYPSIYQSKSAMGTLPSIQHFSAMGKTTAQKTPDQNSGGLQLPVSSGIKPSDLVAAAMKLKVEPSEEKEIADRTIQEQIAAHQLNAVQQQVQDLTAGALAAGNIDAAALLAKLQASNLESELHRFYDAEALQALQQQEPMELTSDMSPGKTGSRRKSRGRPTSIESLRDPLARQSSTSSLGANTSVSGDGEDRTYDCEICGKQFSHNDRLRRHRKIHTAEKPYKCDICGKGFKEKCNLKHHRFIHTGEKPYKCETCGKSFNQRSSLKTHQKVHTGEKPFRCELCEKPFAQKYLLRQHMKKHIELNIAPTQP
ncbi:zinc finger protein sens-like isoform X2 [Mercenaria mercenaria]|uniref:zinc finger protein sens-like isoform X2 n=1 Tax=Mercenaria mercenaria TaxID=6596 RepID=UPI00234E536B|nr:zinc finger protein sens-like isoform X2 [Mercenaria mercenaria]